MPLLPTTDAARVNAVSGDEVAACSDGGFAVGPGAQDSRHRLVSGKSISVNRRHRPR